MKYCLITSSPLISTCVSEDACGRGLVAVSGHVEGGGAEAESIIRELVGTKHPLVLLDLFWYSGNYTERRKGIRKSVGPADNESINTGSTRIWFPGHISLNLGIDPRCKQINIRCSKNLTKPLKNMRS